MNVNRLLGVKGWLKSGSYLGGSNVSNRVTARILTENLGAWLQQDFLDKQHHVACKGKAACCRCSAVVLLLSCCCAAKRNEHVLSSWCALRDAIETGCKQQDIARIWTITRLLTLLPMVLSVWDTPRIRLFPGIVDASLKTRSEPI